VLFIYIHVVHGCTLDHLRADYKCVKSNSRERRIFGPETLHSGDRIYILKRLKTMHFVVETTPEIDFHTLSWLNSTYPCTLWDNSSTRSAHPLAQHSVSGPHPELIGLKNIHNCKMTNDWWLLETFCSPLPCLFLPAVKFVIMKLISKFGSYNSPR
jgi:hypothetical protein